MSGHCLERILRISGERKVFGTDAFGLTAVTL
jgi:hypothetical protein